MIIPYARIVTAVAALGWLAFGISNCRESNLSAKLARAELARAGWTAPQSSRPVIPDAPKGARPIVIVSGQVRYLPTVTGAPPTAASPTPPSGESGGAPCDLNALTVDLRCRAEVLEMSGQAGARLFVSGRLSGYGQVRDLPESRVGDQRLGIETAPPKVAIDLPTPTGRRWWAEVRAGVSSDAELVAGASAGRGHWGGWADYRVGAGRRTVSGGAAVRF